MKKPMTKVVDGILREYLEGIEIIEQKPEKEIVVPRIYKIVKKK